ncbi:hypothetical protein TI39_contig70g00012 [Zymoseptoria brevis]|uniref:Uncharacterized protein n=1 Tax=Zymoseptoria brevis TaxID=1047168 RepID=A0A0F4GXV6_9PEZI|nr:hypothetical protein TI39_contig70g00012 [Zymoseptoria brevis]
MALNTLIGPHANIGGNYTTLTMHALLGCTENEIKRLVVLVVGHVWETPPCSFQQTWSLIGQSSNFWAEAFAGRLRGPRLPDDFHSRVEEVQRHLYDEAVAKKAAWQSASTGDVVAEQVQAKRRQIEDRDRDDDEPELVKRVKVEEDEPYLISSQTVETPTENPAATHMSRTWDDDNVECDGGPVPAPHLPPTETPASLTGTIGNQTKHTIMQAMEIFLESELKARVEEARTQSRHETELELQDKAKILAERELKLRSQEEQLSGLKDTLALQEKALAAQEKKLAAQAKNQASQEKCLAGEVSIQETAKLALEAQEVEADNEREKQQMADRMAKMQRDSDQVKEKAQWESEMTERIRQELTEGMKRALARF